MRSFAYSWFSRPGKPEATNHRRRLVVPLGLEAPPSKGTSFGREGPVRSRPVANRTRPDGGRGKRRRRRAGGGGAVTARRAGASLLCKAAERRTAVSARAGRQRFFSASGASAALGWRAISCGRSWGAGIARGVVLPGAAVQVAPGSAAAKPRGSRRRAPARRRQEERQRRRGSRSGCRERRRPRRPSRASSPSAVQARRGGAAVSRSGRRPSQT